MEYFITANGLSNKRGVLPPNSEIEICKLWINRFARPKRGWSSKHSYGLKHVVERWADEYVCNGAFIQAAVDLGYKISRISGRDCPNCVFNMAFPRKRTQEYYESSLGSPAL